jgi:hypothetical protein
VRPLIYEKRLRVERERKREECKENEAEEI